MMKRTILTILTLLALYSPALSWEQVTNYDLKIGTQNFWSNFLSGTGFSAGQIDTIRAWMADHMDIATGSIDLNNDNPNTVSTGYLDFVFEYTKGLHYLRDVASSEGYVFEDMLLHGDQNYQVLSSYLWSGMDRFDTGEVDNGGNYVKGVFLLDGSTYTDKTTAAYDVTTADVTVSDKLLIGSSDPFADINFTVSSAATKTVAFEYWNGSAWVTLTPTSDTTSNLSTSGLFRFTPPSAWTRKVENGSHSKYWVRISVSGTGNNPVLSRIYGDNWAVSDDGTNNCRGWDSTDENIVGTGELAYNPTPPTSAQAKFRHQARITGLWQPGANFFNHSNIQSSERTIATYLATRAKSLLSASNGGGFMFDDANASPGVAGWDTYYPLHSDYSGSGTLQQERILSIAETRSQIQATYPDVKVGALTLTQDMAYVLDFTMHEDFSTTANILSSTAYNTTTTSEYYSASYDNYLPENNPTGAKGIMMVMDTYHYGREDAGGTGYYWDRGNRTPILALATYYMGENENTYFCYNIGGTNYTYYASPGVYRYWSTDKASLTSALPVAGAGTVDIYGDDFSSFPTTTKCRVGRNIYVQCEKQSSTLLRATVPQKTWFATDVGADIQYVVEATTTNHLALNAVPDGVEVESWGMYFPAMAVNVGTPTESRNTSWKSWSDVGGPNANSQGVWKRDFTNALVLLRPNNYDTTAINASTLSDPIALGGTYYPLRANGTIGAGITSVQLRTGEGAILMKSAPSAACSNDPYLCTTQGNCEVAGWNWCDGGCQSSNCSADPTCSDSTQNGDETGVDCGGSCPSCPAGGAGFAVGGGRFVTGWGILNW